MQGRSHLRPRASWRRWESRGASREEREGSLNRTRGESHLRRQLHREDGDPGGIEGRERGEPKQDARGVTPAAPASSRRWGSRGHQGKRERGAKTGREGSHLRRQLHGEDGDPGGIRGRERGEPKQDARGVTPAASEFHGERGARTGREGSHTCGASVMAKMGIQGASREGREGSLNRTRGESHLRQASFMERGARTGREGSHTCGASFMAKMGLVNEGSESFRG